MRRPSADTLFFCGIHIVERQFPIYYKAEMAISASNLCLWREQGQKLAKSPYLFILVIMRKLFSKLALASIVCASLIMFSINSALAAYEPLPRFFGNIGNNYDSVWGTPQYLEQLNIFAQQLTSENAAKWRFVETTPGVYDWSKIDRELDFAASHGIPYKAHALLWRDALPDYVNHLLTKTERRAAAEAYVRAFMDRYKSRIWAYEVINEPISAPMENLFGGDYVSYFYGLTRTLDPHAKLFINEYGVETSGSKNKAYYKLLSSLKESGLIDGIGVEAHSLENTKISSMDPAFRRLETLELPLYITELDLAISDDALQLSRYKELLNFFMARPQIKGITLWGFWSEAIWRGPSAALLRSDFSERPSATWIRTEFMPMFKNSS